MQIDKNAAFSKVVGAVERVDKEFIKEVFSARKLPETYLLFSFHSVGLSSEKHPIVGIGVGYVIDHTLVDKAAYLIDWGKQESLYSAAFRADKGPYEDLEKQAELFSTNGNNYITVDAVRDTGITLPELSVALPRFIDITIGTHFVPVVSYSIHLFFNPFVQKLFQLAGLQEWFTNTTRWFDPAVVEKAVKLPYAEKLQFLQNPPDCFYEATVASKTRVPYSLNTVATIKYGITPDKSKPLCLQHLDMTSQIVKLQHAAANCD